MNCQRCEGLMVPVQLDDMEGTVMAAYLGWRCLQCGNIQDPGIDANRHGHTHPLRSRARPRYPHAAKR
ncbi:MAG TPA: hypothetical protein VFA38_05135 [Nitrospirales bacterium]|nr:hypothetical protein [Nitrospirales bacterium]